MNVPPFENRWLFTGSLTTLSKLHLGDGGDAAIACRTRPADPKSDCQTLKSDASTVAVDFRGRAFIPGSAIKGALRSHLYGQSLWDSHWEQLLGSEKPDAIESVGGKLVFFDAFHSKGTGEDAEAYQLADSGSTSDRHRPYWDPNRRTCVAVHVSLDDRTRTAVNEALFHLEYVPAGETFHVEIGGENLTPQEVQSVVNLLNSFNHGVCLGAKETSGWGKTQWDQGPAHQLCYTQVEQWKCAPQAGYRFAETAPAFPLPEAQPLAASPKECLEFDIQIAFDSPFLIRDSRQAERSAARKNSTGPKPPDAVPILDENGRPVISGESLRGVLNAQAERILSTLDLRTGLARELFGADQRRAAVICPPFITREPLHEFPQEFLGSDRFTGGVAGSAKFDAEQCDNRIFEGKITLKSDRLPPGKKQAALGLLALVLRDLEDGDIRIGSGSAKGLGECRATINLPGQTAWKADPRISQAVSDFRNLIPQQPPTI